MFQNGQAHFNNFTAYDAAYDASFLKCVRDFGILWIKGLKVQMSSYY